MIKVLGKLGLSSGAVLGVTSLSNPVLSNLPIKPQIEKRTTISDITKFEDIDIWAKENGCSFVFENKWKSKAYSSEEFILIEQKNPTKFDGKKAIDISEWKKKMIDHAQKNKGSCKRGNTLTFLWYDHKSEFISKPSELAYQTSRVNLSEQSS